MGFFAWVFILWIVCCCNIRCSVICCSICCSCSIVRSCGSRCRSSSGGCVSSRCGCISCSCGCIVSCVFWVVWFVWSGRRLEFNGRLIWKTWFDGYMWIWRNITWWFPFRLNWRRQLKWVVRDYRCCFIYWGWFDTWRLYLSYISIRL